MPELHALLGVRRHLIQGTLGAAGASRRESESPGIEHVHRDAESAAHSAEQMIDGNLERLVAQLRLCRAADAELVHGADHLEPRHVGADQKGSHALHRLATPLNECLRESRNHASAMAIPDPDLPSVEPPVRSILAQRRGRLDVLGIRSDIRLGQRIGSEKITARKRRQIALLLLVVPVQHDRLGAKAAVDADENGERCVDRGQRLEDSRVRGRRQLQPTVLLRNGEPQHPRLGKSADDILGDRLFLIELRGVDQIALHLAEALDQAANGARLVGVPFIEPTRIWKKKRVEDYTREDPAGER